ncbi:MAG: CRISPR-associated endonuclease Cas2 [Bacteroidetes bacterium]|nr:CRISPR-associated endonuclease Cas2 [Bacteroidota bacterium]
MSPRRKRKEVSFVEHMLGMKRAGLTHRSAGLKTPPPADPLAPLDERIAALLEIHRRHHANPERMLYFIFYDIENNKVRNQIAKYLIRNGCLRVQKSVFFAESERQLFDRIYHDLKTIQELYDNTDSIFFVPVSADQLRAMKIVGQSMDFDLVIGNRTTLFF